LWISGAGIPAARDPILLDRSRMAHPERMLASTATSLDDVRTELTALRLEVAELRALLVREPPRTWETTAEAAERVGRSEQTIRSWVRRFRIGIMVAGAWRVDRDLLDRLLADRAGAHG
jgi:hypothetical protein